MSVEAGPRMLAGRYRVGSLIASGGMASVYRGRDVLLGREVAIKVLDERLATEPRFVDRFEREGRAATRLTHPNIVQVFDHGRSDGHHFIAMEYVDGTTLAQLLAERGPLTAERAATIAADIADGLDHAHACGMVHRDVTPSNVLINAGGRAMITDFGIARLLDDENATTSRRGMVLGTAAYVSPENFQGRPADERSDVYALGVVLFEMLTGSPPFEGESSVAIAFRHVNERPAAPSSIHREVPGELDAIVLRALAKHPEDRFAGIADMRDELDAFLSGRPVRASAPREAHLARTPVLPLQRPRRVLRWGAALLACGALAAGLALGFSALVGRERAPQLEGRYWPDAQRRLDELSLNVRVEERFSDSVPEDFVIAQTPEAGTEVAEGDTAYVVVSAGTEPDFLEEITYGVEEYLELYWRTIEAAAQGVETVIGTR